LTPAIDIATATIQSVLTFISQCFQDVGTITAKQDIFLVRTTSLSAKLCSPAGAMSNWPPST